jgi:hypothetical protein
VQVARGREESPSFPLYLCIVVDLVPKFSRTNQGWWEEEARIGQVIVIAMAKAAERVRVVFISKRLKKKNSLDRRIVETANR